ncbi:hypothetical protein RUM44_012661 [Polyplax serrata]|uniref:Inositol-1-monophosphatase n=1 Tax=Polyplax serrata TaxID=468196 RepID=A0ABR1BG52_POLSC
MSSVELNEYFKYVKEIIIGAGQTVIEGLEQDDKNVETKGNIRFDLVTVFDRRVEDDFTTKIKQRYPDHQIIGEETWPANVTPKLTDTPTWIIDPIDGTINYIKKIPFIGISVALAIKGEIVIGIVYNPITNQFYSAIKGEGSYLNGKRIYATKNDDLRKAVIGNEISLASIPFLHDRTIERVRKLTEFGVLGFRSFGSAAISLCNVADGSLDVYFTDGLKCWDVAAGVLILEEAGGCAGNPNGKPFNMFSRVLLTAGNKVLLDKMVTILTECDEKTIAKVRELISPELRSVLEN